MDSLVLTPIDRQVHDKFLALVFDFFSVERPPRPSSPQSVPLLTTAKPASAKEKYAQLVQLAKAHPPAHVFCASPRHLIVYNQSPADLLAIYRDGRSARR